jgi:peptidoglycan/LPS O-acetylase OafA/YrhL
LDWILQRLRRITLTTVYLPEIDGLRFIAIIAVIFCHISADMVQRHEVRVQPNFHWLYTLTLHGERGVHLFFTISGFVLALPFAKRYLCEQGPPLDLRRYFRRRLLRLEPPYLFNVAVCTVATWMIKPNLRPILLSHFVAAVTYTHLILFHYVNIINMAWWSLEIEAQFYLLMPLLAFIFKVRSVPVRRWIVFLVAASAFLWQNATSSWIVGSTILAQIQFFLVGLLVADLYQSGVLRRNFGLAWDVLGSASVMVLFVLPSWWRSAAPELTFLILVGALKGDLFRRFLSLSWIAAIGSMCYTIYLWHVFVMALVLKATIRLPLRSDFLLSMVVQAALILPAIFFFSVAMFLAVEKPCMEPNWPAKLSKFLRGTLLRLPVTVSATTEAE